MLKPMINWNILHRSIQVLIVNLPLLLQEFVDIQGTLLSVHLSSLPALNYALIITWEQWLLFWLALWVLSVFSFNRAWQPWDFRHELLWWLWLRLLHVHDWLSLKIFCFLFSTWRLWCPGNAYRRSCLCFWFITILIPELWKSLRWSCLNKLIALLLYWSVALCRCKTLWILLEWLVLVDLGWSWLVLDVDLLSVLLLEVFLSLNGFLRVIPCSWIGPFAQIVFFHCLFRLRLFFESLVVNAASSGLTFRVLIAFNSELSYRWVFCLLYVFKLC